MSPHLNRATLVRALPLTILLFAVSTLLPGVRGEEERPLLAKYRGEMKCPDALYAAHARFVNAMKTGDADAIRACCLPAAVAIENKVRQKHVEYGPDINIPFAKTCFTAEILALRDEGVGCVLVRTGTSYLRYVLTAKHGWRLYDYGDKPIR